MAASMFSTRRPLAIRTVSGKSSTPYLTLTKSLSPTSITAAAAGPPVPDMIMPNLYLTDLFTARQTLLPTYPSPHRPHVKYVLSILDNSITQPYPKPASRASQFEQRLIILDDTPDADLLAHLADACDWIDACRARADGAVLVHCHLGQSRSAAVVVAYVMRADRVPLARALERVRRRRAVVRPNPGFVAQLELWEGMAYDVWEDVEVEVEVDVAAVDCDKQNENESASDPVVDQPQPKHTVRRRKQAYDTWKTEQEKRTKRFLENLA